MELFMKQEELHLKFGGIVKAQVSLRAKWSWIVSKREAKFYLDSKVMQFVVESGCIVSTKIGFRKYVLSFCFELILFHYK